MYSMYKRKGALRLPLIRSDAGGSVPTASSRHRHSVGVCGCASVFNEGLMHPSGISCFSTAHQSIPYRPRIFAPTATGGLDCGKRRVMQSLRIRASFNGVGGSRTPVLNVCRSAINNTVCIYAGSSISSSRYALCHAASGTNT
jgi:hypothetical protein